MYKFNSSVTIFINRVTEKVKKKGKNMDNKIYAVGLGPGDYEMMSLKAKRILEESHIIFLNGGRVFNSLEEVTSILDKINCGSKVKYYEFTGESSSRLEKLKAFVDDMVDCFKKGMKVSYVTMGDMTIYSSFPDIYSMLAEYGISLEAVTGIPSFLAPASLTGVSIVDFKDRAAIIPNPEKAEDIEKLFPDFQTVIIMKITDNGKVLKEYIEKYKPKYAYAVFNAYNKNQKIYNLLESMPLDSEEYFMCVVMVKK